MSTKEQMALGCLGIAGLALVGVVAMVALNWDATREALDVQGKKTQATLFRLGELASIGSELKAEFGTKPEVTYETVGDDRVLGIAFDNYPLPEDAAAESHAREIAIFALEKTTKHDQIDTIDVSFQGSGPYRFTLDELIPADR